MPKEYYDHRKILAEGSTYNVVIGQRSNGKTYGFIEEALAEYCENGHPSVYIRRYDESITGANIFKLCCVMLDISQQRDYSFTFLIFQPIAATMILISGLIRLKKQ